MMFSCRTIRTDQGKIVAACDRDILGETYTEDGVKLEVRKDFYSGEKIELHKVLEHLENFFTANLVGNSLVDSLLEEGVVEHSEVEEVDGVKHIQLFRV